MKQLLLNSNPVGELGTIAIVGSFALVVVVVLAVYVTKNIMKMANEAIENDSEPVAYDGITYPHVVSLEADPKSHDKVRVIIQWGKAGKKCSYVGIGTIWCHSISGRPVSAEKRVDLTQLVKEHNRVN